MKDNKINSNNIVILCTVLICMLLSYFILISSLDYCKTIGDVKSLIKITLPVTMVATLLIISGVMLILSANKKEKKKGSILDKGKEIFGIIDEYNLNELKKRDLKKEEKFAEIIKKDKKIIEELEEYFEKKTTIYTIEKEHIIYGLYVFLVENDEVNNVRTIYSKEVSKEIIEKYDNLLVKSYKDLVMYGDYKKVTVQDKVIEKDPTKSTKEIVLKSIIGFIAGFGIGYAITDDISLGIVWAIIFGPILSGVEVVVYNKNNK